MCGSSPLSSVQICNFKKALWLASPHIQISSSKMRVKNITTVTKQVATAAGDTTGTRQHLF